MGPSGLTWQGAWSAATTYFSSDAVSHLGSSWVALNTTISSTPAEGLDWTLLAMAGAAGIPGARGPVGPAGEDGLPGLAGLDGATGATGPAGADGIPGPQGAAGSDGRNGTNGTNGANGAPGPVGPTGPQGGVGPQGPQGPSLAVTPWIDGGFQNHLHDFTTTGFEQVATVSLAPGSYVVFGKVGLYNLSSGPLSPECWLTQDGDVLDTTQVLLAYGGLATIPFQASIVVGSHGSSVVLSCMGLGLRTYFPHLAALQVGTLTVQP
jgi:hypothetical protein